jgi:hypothetical protein
MTSSSAFSASTRSLKRSRKETSPASSTPATKRLPGFSIYTKDGVDITDYASRGPKSKEQREAAALMRKLKACMSCKQRKQRVYCASLHPFQTLLTINSAIQAIIALLKLLCQHQYLLRHQRVQESSHTPPPLAGHEHRYLLRQVSMSHSAQSPTVQLLTSLPMPGNYFRR